MSQIPPDYPPSLTPCTDEVAVLKIRIAELERDKDDLNERATSAEANLSDANTRVLHARKYAAECEAGMKVATARAQARYTEKLHANNESRNLRNEIDRQKSDLHDYHIKVTRCFDAQNAKMAQLRADKQAGKWSGEYTSEVQNLRADLEVLRNELLSALKEDAKHKAEWEERKGHIKVVVMKLSAELTAERAKVAASAEELTSRVNECKAKYQSQMDPMKEEHDAVLKEGMRKSQNQLDGVQAQWFAKEKHMMDCNNPLKRQLDEAHTQVHLGNQQLQVALHSIHGDQQNFLGSQQGQQKSTQQSFTSSKRMRHNSISTAGRATPDLQRARTHSLPSNYHVMDPNGGIAPNSQQYMMPPHGIHRRQSSQLSNGSPHSMTPTQRLRQEHNVNSVGCSVGHDSGSTRQVQLLLQQPKIGYMSLPEQGQPLQHLESGNTEDQLVNQAIFHDQMQNTMGMELQHWSMPQLMVGDRSDARHSIGTEMMGATSQSWQQEMNGEHMMPNSSQFAAFESAFPTLKDMQDMQSQQQPQQAPTTPKVNDPTPNIIASSLATPAPKTVARRRAPPPVQPVRVPCVNCYKHWWDGDCDEGEPCENCVAEKVDCLRQRCFHFATGTCPKGLKCPNVHEGDRRYNNDRFLVDQPKASKRPGRLGKSTEAEAAPVLRQQQG